MTNIMKEIDEVDCEMMQIMYGYQKEVGDSNATIAREIIAEHKSGKMDPSRKKLLNIKIMKKF